MGDQKVESAIGDGGMGAQPFRLQPREDVIGAERAMFASNFPVDSLCGSFDDIYSGFKHIVRDLPRADQERLFYSNAQRIYRCEPCAVARPWPEQMRSQA